ncbi:hypothetical protein ACKKBF_B40590 [Auxenochlorella protothecoides x Auxenochlorella symbiontica]
MQSQPGIQGSVPGFQAGDVGDCRCDTGSKSKTQAFPSSSETCFTPTLVKEASTNQKETLPASTTSYQVSTPGSYHKAVAATQPQACQSSTISNQCGCEVPHLRTVVG